jgi:hypothetical protein
MSTIDREQEPLSPPPLPPLTRRGMVRPWALKSLKIL